MSYSPITTATTTTATTATSATTTTTTAYRLIMFAKTIWPSSAGSSCWCSIGHGDTAQYSWLTADSLPN